jgi:hypothetical protein
MPITKPKGKLIKAANYRVKYKDIFTAKEFYTALREYFKENGWHDGNGFEQYEVFLLEKITPGGFKEMTIRWRLQKTPDGSKYFRYHMDLDFLFLGVTTTEVVREGIKYKTNKGEVELTVTAQVEIDYEGKWRKHPLMKHFWKLFTERILGGEIYNEHRLELYREAYQLQNFIKQWFKMHRFLPYEESKAFFTSEAWPSHIPE